MEYFNSFPISSIHTVPRQGKSIALTYYIKHCNVSSKTLREIAMALYFTRLNNETSTIIPWPELILAATPYEISWNQLAVHCLTVEVVSDLKIICINWYDLGMVY